jgi:hypothetical protein
VKATKARSELPRHPLRSSPDSDREIRTVATLDSPATSCGNALYADRLETAGYLDLFDSTRFAAGSLPKTVAADESTKTNTIAESTTILPDSRSRSDVGERVRNRFLKTMIVKNFAYKTRAP